MAKLTFYQQQTTPSQLGPGAINSVPNVPNPYSGTLDAMVGIAGQVGKEITRRQEDAAAVDASSRVMSAHRHWIEREQQLRNEALESGDIDGLTERVTKEYEQYAAAEIGQAKTPAARQWMQERMGQLGLSMFERSTAWEASAKVERDVGLADRALSDAQVVVDADPTQFGAALETLKLPFARLPADKREAAWAKARSDVAEYAARRGAEANPGAVLRALDRAAPRQQAVEQDLTGQYNTKLTPEQEQKFQAWLQETGRANDLYDYDMRGAWLEMQRGDLTPDERGHLTDRFKKPNHPTFSTGSQYSGQNGQQGGTWERMADGSYTYTPSASVLQQHSPEALRQYFAQQEKGNRLLLPAGADAPVRTGIDYLDALDADGRVRVRAAAEGRIRELEAEARARRAEARDTLSMRIQNQTAQIEAGLGVPNPITRGEFAAAGLSAADYAGYQGLVQQGADYQALWRLPESDIKALVAGRDPAQTPGSAVEAGFASRFRLNQQLRARAADVLAAREADPGTYLYQYSPGVAQAYDAIGQAQTPQEAEAAAQNYARAATSESRRLGIRNPAILPQAYADAIVSDFEQQDQGGEPAALRIIGERAKWGRYWPQVMRQIGSKLPGTAAVIGTGMRPQPAARLAEFGRLKDEEVGKLLPAGTSQRDVHDAVAGELEDFRATIAGQPGEPQTYGMLADAAYRLAVAHMAEGRSATDAATMAAAEVVNERYQFIESRGSRLRVPVGVPTSEVQGGLRALWHRDVSALGYPRLDEAQWQTLPDDSGVALVYQGSVVRRRDGAPVTYSWQAIRNREATVGEDARQLDRDLRDPARDRLP